MSTNTRSSLTDLVTLAPVTIELTRVCHFKQKPCGRCGKAKTNPVHRQKDGLCRFKIQRMCARCGKAKAHRDHLGAPPSYNILGSGSQRTYIGLKQTWQPILVDLMEEAGLPKGLHSVRVEGEVSYGNGHVPDEDNAIALIRKFLSDAFQSGEWIKEDTWGRVKFSNLELHQEPGVSRLRLVIFPMVG